MGWLSLGVTAGDREPGAPCSHWGPRTLLGHEPSAAEVGHWSEGRGPAGWQHPMGVQAGWQRQHPSPEIALGHKANASLLLLGAEKAESGAGQKEVVQDRLDVAGCVLGSTAKSVPPMGVALMGPWYPY